MKHLKRIDKKSNINKKTLKKLRKGIKFVWHVLVLKVVEHQIDSLIVFVEELFQVK